MLSEKEIDALKQLHLRGRISGDDMKSIVADTSELLANGYVIFEWNKSLGYGYSLSHKGRAALADYEAQQEPTLTDTIYNGREQLARQMHDPATLDSAPKTISFDEFKRLTDEMETERQARMDEALEREYRDSYQYDIDQLEKRIAELEAQNEALMQAIEPMMKFRDEVKDWAEAGVRSGTGRKPLFGFTVRYADDTDFLSGDIRPETLLNLFDTYNRYKGASDE